MPARILTAPCRAAPQLAFTHLPPLSPLLGLLTGALYRSDLLPPSLRTYRLPLPLAAFVARWGWVGSTRAPRRLTRAVPEELLPGMGGAGGLQGGMGTGIGGVVGRAGRREARRENEEVITTAPAPAPPGSPASAAPSLPSSPTSPTPTVPITPSAPHGIAAPAQGPAQGVMRAWVSELSAAAGGRGGGGVRVPSDAEVAQVASMFPDLGRGVVVGALQRRCVCASFLAFCRPFCLLFVPLLFLEALLRRIWILTRFCVLI